MTPQQFEQMEHLFFLARELPEDQWPRFLDSACADDVMIREEVEALLRTASRINPPASKAEACGEGVTRKLQGALAPPAGAGATGAAPDQLLGRQVDNLQIIEQVGCGGMGIVYKARDVTLHRTVALKALPAGTANDPLHLSRFRREAKLLASLSHPNVAVVYALTERGGSLLLEMEFIDGLTLAARLKRGRLPLADALEICRAIAAGVEAAHNAGVIHRDLKPGNVMIARDGTVKVLDFGLAREVAAEPPANGATEAITSAPGTIAGTPGYMSPEQLRGETLDRRCDVFAFGCILYECLTGLSAFGGSTRSQADTVAAVLEREPDWSKLPERTPPAVRRLLARCLAKKAEQRLRDIGDARLELDDSLSAPTGWTSVVTPALARTSRGRRAVTVLSLLAAAGALLAIVFMVTRSPEPSASAPQPLQRFMLSFPNGQAQSDLPYLRVALSRDGARMVLAANNGQTRGLFLRDRDRGDYTLLEGTVGARVPSFSPDGQWVLYFEDGTISKRPLAGGNPARVASVRGYWSPYCWSADGHIAYNAYWGKGLARIHSDGGPSEFVTDPNYNKDEFAHLAPFTLPDGSAILYTVWNGKSGLRIDAVNVATRERHTVIEDASCPRVVSTPRGPYLLFERTTTIYAAPFDTKALRRTGPEKAIADNVLFDVVFFAAAYDVADDGTLVYIPGPKFIEESRLAWLTPGEQTPVPVDDYRMGMVEPNFSADGTKLSIILKNDVFKPYIYDCKAGIFERVVVDGDVETCAISPDGQSLAYCTNKDGPYDVWVRRLADGHEEKLYDGSGDCQAAITWSPDGKTIAFGVVAEEKNSGGVFMVDIESRRVRTFCDSWADERVPRWSPDGKWIAYASNETGTREIYLRSYPDGSQKRQVSFGGGDWPIWSPDGSKLYYRVRGELWAMPMNPADGTVVGRTEMVYGGTFGQGIYEMPDYTMHPDGKLLLIEPSERAPKVSQINVILHWYRLLDDSVSSHR